MNKILLLSLIIINIYGSEIKYYLDYLDENNLIKTIELQEDKYKITKKNLEYYKDKKYKLTWVMNNKEYEILKMYEDKKENKNKSLDNFVKEQLEYQEQGKEKKENSLNNKRKQEEPSPNNNQYIGGFIIVLIFLILTRKKKNINYDLENLEEKKIEDNNKKFNYEELEKNRVEIYKNLKYNKEIDKDKKKELYKKINLLKNNITNKEDLEKLNKDFTEIKKGVSNG